ncbi:MAG: helix-turn-helix transcriptional regulator [Clostridia bacterium]|nr:helix-turn-helix transcriptional regulator [Clostridia bacterium]
MIGFIECPTIISTAKKETKAYGKIQNRASHGFIFKIKGKTEYLIDGNTITLSEGEMIFLPKGSSYEYKSLESDENLYTSINYLADIENPKIALYTTENFYRINYIHESFTELWNFGSVSDRCTCMSVFYDLLSYITKLEAAQSIDEEKHMRIEPAVEYMRKHIYECSFHVEKLHARCGISDTYFRRIFKDRFGLSPKEYVTTVRISHARSIIESGDYASIAEVAESVGYSDPLYFSKAFKRVYGVCPSGIDD